MSFIWFRPAGPLRTREQVATEVHAVSVARGLDELATAIALITIATEVGADDEEGNPQWWCPCNDANPQSHGYPYDSQSNDGRSVGYFQQQYGPGREPWWGTTESMMTLSEAANEFLSRLSEDYASAAGNPALAGQFAQQVQGSSFPDRYAAKWDEAHEVMARALAPAPAEPAAPAPAPTPQPEAPVGDRPDFNEYANWTTNFQSRGTTKVDLFLLHTQEGAGNADSLAKFLNSTEGGPNPVSYHYTISEDPNDHGVTVVDVVNTDAASWSVGNSNDRAINLCFAGSSANWSRDEWMLQSRAIDVAAYLAAQDCKRYGIYPRVIPGPNYNSDPPGISDHRYCSDYLQDGNNHVDVGDGFPWDYFAERVAFWAAPAAPEPSPVPPPAPAPEPSPVPEPTTAPAAADPFQEFLDTASDRALLVYIAAQLGPGDLTWASKGSTLRDKVWSLN